MRCSHEALPKTFPLPRFKLYWSMFAKKIGAKGKSQKNIQKRPKKKVYNKLVQNCIELIHMAN
jgi:hypothetical protein